MKLKRLDITIKPVESELNWDIVEFTVGVVASGKLFTYTAVEPRSDFESMFSRLMRVAEIKIKKEIEEEEKE